MLVTEAFRTVQNVMARWVFKAGFLLPRYTTATRPLLGAADASVIIYVTDAATGALFQGWNGTAWVSLDQNTDSGVYTPTITNVANVAASSLVAESVTYLRVGNVVTVSGRINITPTAAGTVLTELTLSLPYLGGLTVDGMGGMAVNAASGLRGVSIFTIKFSASTALFVGNVVTDTANVAYAFQFQYHVS